MQRFCRNLKEVCAIASRVGRGRIVLVCSQCNTASSGHISNEEGERAVVKGIAIDNSIYCKDHAFARLRIAHPGLTDAELEARLKLYRCDDCVGIPQLYYYDATNGPSATT